jgi:septum formation protein
MKNLILASGSPRRKEILAKTGIDFKVVKSKFVEDMSQNIGPGELAKKLALGKAMDVAKNHEKAVVLGADTIIFFQDKVVGKPKSEGDAVIILNKLSGNVHSVFTGFAIVDIDRHKKVVKYVETKIFFRKLSEEEIVDYVSTGESLDKAGAYAYQGKGAVFVEKIEGDYYNVIGLPLCSVVVELRKFGF